MDTSRNSVFQSFAAGAASGTVSSVMLQPLDMVKTRLQTCPNVPLHVHFRTIYYREGGLAFWKGLGPTLVRTVPGVGLYFSCLNYLQYVVCGSRTPSSLEFMVLGGVSRTVAATVLMPATVLKIRFESGMYRYTSLFQALGHLARHEGVRGLTSGIVPTLLRDVPFSSVYLFFYTSFKTVYKERSRKKLLPPTTSLPPPPSTAASGSPSSAGSGPSPKLPTAAGTDLANFLCGLCAGLLACGFTQPFDVIKTKMQIKIGSRHSWALIKEIWQGRGLAGFFIGLTPRLLRRTLMASFSWTLYERLMRGQKPVRKAC